MGGLDFTQFQTLSMIHPVFAQIIIFSLMIITNITLLNFAIAILSNTYAIMTTDANPIYLVNIL